MTVKSNFEVRLATVDDLAPLAVLYRQLHPEDGVLRADVLKATLARFALMPGSGVFLGLVAGQVVASVSLAIIPNLTRGGRPFAVFENVVTHEDHRGKGLGRDLLVAAIEHAWMADCYKIMLMTGSQNPAVLAFYEGLGFARSKTGFDLRAPGKSPESAQ